MRGIILATLFTSGALAMTADAQDKKDPPKKADEIPEDKRFTETVSVRKYLTATKMFVVKPQDDIGAYRGKVKDKDVIYLSTRKLADFDAGSEITDKDGNVYRVDKKFQATGPNTGYGCFVTLSRPADKKPE